MKKFKLGDLVKLNPELKYEFHKPYKKSVSPVASHKILDLKNDIGLVSQEGNNNSQYLYVFWIKNNIEKAHYINEVKAI
jgi:hypothetical protein